MSRPTRLAAVGALAILSAGIAISPRDRGIAQTTDQLRLASRYDVDTIGSPVPTLGGRFGSALSNIGDVTGDGVDELLVGEPVNDGRVHLVDPVTGNTVYTVEAPDPSSGGGRAAFGFASTTARLDDLGSCAGGAPGSLCPQSPIGAPDGVSEFIVGAQGTDPSPERVDYGRAYVFDGATGALLKRVEIPESDAAEQDGITGSRPNFGRTVTSPASSYPAEAPDAVKVGDLDGGGMGDFVVGAFGYDETSATHAECPDACARSGRAYIYRGEDIVASDPGSSLAVPLASLKNPMPQDDDPASASNTNTENFSGGFFPLGDIGGCMINPGPGAVCPNRHTTTTPDGISDLAIAAFRTDFPEGFVDSGVVWLFDGSTASILHRFVNPEPQYSALFGSTDYSTPIGNVGESALPDIYIPTVGANGRFVAEGKGYVFSGNFQAVSHRSLIAILSDPTPAAGGNFGTSSAGIGDVAGDFHNEILVGSVGPRFPGLHRSIVNDVHVFSAVSQTVVYTFEDPDQQEASGFGSALAPLGDINDDGFVDVAVSAPGFDTATIDEGRLYIFRSLTEPQVELRCPGFEQDTRNQLVGTSDSDILVGSETEDIICGMAGSDTIRGAGGDDLLIGGSGRDLLRGGDGSDTMLGRRGADTLVGGQGDDVLRGHRRDDTLRGGPGNDDLNGGPGRDVCRTGRGDDTVRNC